nr:unnamed protein product [Callosobruchus analis]
MTGEVSENRSAIGKAAAVVEGADSGR